MTVKASIIIPTTGDRGPLLPLSVESVLAQTEQDFEVVIVGDGVTDSTRAVIAELSEADSRIRFFDFPKHPRRGEENRHAALGEATGEIVCYLCDRDYMLPCHVATMRDLLEQADFAHTLRATFTQTGIAFNATPDIQSAEDLSAIRDYRLAPAIPLSHAGHTMEMYRRLPHGWRTTPAYLYTDVHMWQQILEQPGCRTAASPRLTVLHLKRGDYPGWPVEKRRALLENWNRRLGKPGAIEALNDEVYAALTRDHSRLSRRLRPRTKQLLRRVVLGNPALFHRLLSSSVPRQAARRIAWLFYGRRT